MLELISPAGCAEAVIAAVQNGADAVCFGMNRYNSRLDAKNLTDEEVYKAAEYCRIRGVKSYIILDSAADDTELHYIAECARNAVGCGIDAIMISDLGVLRAVRQTAPDMPVIADERMGLHSLDGIRTAAAMGITCAVVSSSLPLAELETICKGSPIDICVPVHGPLCISASGQCYISAMNGTGSDNRGKCSYPCRKSYGSGSHSVLYPLSLKDLCLIGHLEELRDAGVSRLLITGRERRPEYSAVVTGIYSRAIKEGRIPTDDDLHAMSGAFSKNGTTDAFFTDMKGSQMFGTGCETSVPGTFEEGNIIFSTARRNYLNGEMQRVPVKFFGLIKKGEPARLAAMDDRGCTASAEGLTPEEAFQRELTPASLRTQLHNTGSTPFYCEGAKCIVDPGLSLPTSAISELRREVLVSIMRKRQSFVPGRTEKYESGYRLLNREEPPVMTVSVRSLSQLSRDMLDYSPALIYVPLEAAATASGAAAEILSDSAHIAVTLPRIIHDSERKNVETFMRTARDRGIKQALVGNIGHVVFARSLGFEVRGDFGLNSYNAQTLKILRDLGLVSATLPFEINLKRICEISKPIDTELIAYGRLPLMLSENCIIHSCMGVCTCDNFTGLSDGEDGANYPVMREYGCRNVLLSSKKLYMADKRSDLDSLGLWAFRLSFTTENARECVSVLDAYAKGTDSRPIGCTHGMYYKEAE